MKSNLNTKHSEELGLELDRDIYNIRYQAYLDNDSIDANGSKAFVDEYDNMPNCTSHLELYKGQPAASIRGCVYNPLDKINTIPAMEIFAEDIEREIGWESCFVESNKFVVHPQFQNKGYRLKLALFRFIFNLALENKADRIITCVRPEHVAFYKRLSFEPISGVKQYPKLKFSTVLLASQKFDTARNDDNSCILKKLGIA